MIGASARFKDRVAESLTLAVVVTDTNGQVLASTLLSFECPQGKTRSRANFGAQENLVLTQTPKVSVNLESSKLAPADTLPPSFATPSTVQTDYS